MSRRVLFGAWWLGSGCSLDPVVTAAPDVDEPRTERAGEYYGPGEWRPAARTRARPAEVTIVRSGLVGAPDATVSASGALVLFVQGGNVCGAGTLTGSMESDVPIGGDSGDTGVAESWNTDVDPTVPDSSPDEQALVLDQGTLVRVDLAGSGAVPTGLTDLVDAVVLADGSAAGLAADGTVRFEDGTVVATPLNLVSGWDLAVAGDALLAATVDAVVRVDRAGAHVVAEGAWFVAADPVSGAWVRGSERGLVGPSWTWRAPGAVVDVLDGGDTGTFLVRVSADGDQRVHVLDAPTGEELGVLELRDDLARFDASEVGGVLFQLRAREGVTWRLERR